MRPDGEFYIRQLHYGRDNWSVVCDLPGTSIFSVFSTSGSKPVAERIASLLNLYGLADIDDLEIAQ
jgi:hypothetical protein